MPYNESEEKMSQSVEKRKKLRELRKQLEELIARQEWLWAYEVINEMLQIEPSAELFYHRGVFLLRIEHYEEALKSFEEAYALAPDTKEIQDKIAHMHQILSTNADIRTMNRQTSGEANVQAEPEKTIPKSRIPKTSQLSIVKDSTKTSQLSIVKDSLKTSLKDCSLPASNFVFQENFGQLQRYEFIGELGRGGMGVVYLVRDLELKREVAFKAILQSDNQELVTRFIQEAKAMAKLSHPNIVKVYDIGKVANAHYFTMDFIDGCNLKNLLCMEKITLRRTVEITRKVAIAIDYAHQNGILHRDLKPANVMLQKDGQPMVMDFGLAREIQSDLGVSKSGMAIGTPAYMSPEQVLGERKAIDERSDVYGLGAILYELLTGRPPFQGESAASILLQVVEKNPLPPSRIVGDIPKEVENICLKALAREKYLRYQSAHEFAKDLDRFLNGEPVLALGAGWRYKVIKWIARNRVFASVVSVCLISIFMVAVFAGWQIHDEAKKARQSQGRALLEAEKAKRAEELAKSREQEAHDARHKEQEAKLEATKRLVFSYLASADRAWDDGEQQLACLLYAEAIKRAECLPHALRRLLRLTMAAHITRLTQCYYVSPKTSSMQCIAFSPNGKMIAMANADHNIYLADAEEKSILATLRGHTGSVSSVAFSRDNNLLASTAWDGTVRLWDIAMRKQLHIFHGHEHKVHDVAFSPVEPLIASAGQGGAVLLWDISTKKHKATLTKHAHDVTCVAFSPDGRSLASGSKDNRVFIWDVATQKVKHTFQGYSQDIWDLTFSPDGKTLAAAGDDMVLLWHIENGNRIVLKGHMEAVNQVIFSPDGMTLASASDDRTIRLWDISSESVYAVCRGHSRQVRSIAFAPNVPTLASVSGSREKTEKIHTVRLWQVQPQAHILKGLWSGSKNNIDVSFQSHFAEISTVVFDHNGQNFLSASNDSTLRLWNLQDRKTRLVLLSMKENMALVFIDTDGKIVSDTDNTTLGRFIIDKSHVTCAAFNLDSTIIAMGNRHGNVILWNLKSQKVQEILKQHTERIRAVEFSPDGGYLASSGEDEKIILWNLSNYQPTPISEKGLFPCLAFNPNGTIMACGKNNGKIFVWDLKLAKMIRNFKAHDQEVTCIAFHPNGALFASGSSDKVICIWETSNYNLQTRLKRHTYGIRSLDFTSNGKTIVSGSNDKTIRLWDVATYRCYLTLRGHARAVTSLTLNPAGTIAVSGGDDHAIGIWDISIPPAFLDEKVSAEDIEKTTQNITGLRFDGDFLVEME